jgi:hypothetical protein
MTWTIERITEVRMEATRKEQGNEVNHLEAEGVATTLQQPPVMEVVAKTVTSDMIATEGPY